MFDNEEAEEVFGITVYDDPTAELWRKARYVLNVIADRVFYNHLARFEAWWSGKYMKDLNTAADELPNISAL